MNHGSIHSLAFERSFSREHQRLRWAFDSLGKQSESGAAAPHSKTLARRITGWLLFGGFLACSATALAGGSAEDYERALTLAKRTENTVFRSTFQMHWLLDKKLCWYQVQTGPKAWENVIVDLQSGALRRSPNRAALGLPLLHLTTSHDGSLTEHPSPASGLATSVHLSNRLAEPVDLFWIDSAGERRLYGRLEPGGEREQSTYAGHVWLLADLAGSTLSIFDAAAEPSEIVIDGKSPVQKVAMKDERSHGRDFSPDGQWEVRFENHNLELRRVADGKTEILTTDGTEKREYRGPAAWSPDSQSFVVINVINAPVRQVTLVESSPKDQLQPKVLTYPYPKPGDPLPVPRPVLVRLADRHVNLIDNALFPTPFAEAPQIDVRWSPRSDEFYFDYNQRGHQVYRIVAVKAATGEPRAVVEEKSETFIDYTSKTWRHWLDKTGELLWMSERDGWCGLYLVDVATGTVKNRLLCGNGLVRKVLQVDEDRREVWFMASGLREGEDPYHQHLCRAGFDGGRFVQLTEGDGNHEVKFSPDRKYFVDRWSRVDLPPVSELRRSDTGARVCELEHGDDHLLWGTGWTAPERFTAKGRDGRTDIYGIIIKPPHFDPAQKYPVLEEVYAGPHGSFVPQSFGVLTREYALAELGFVVVRSDGMGTNNRGKVFHDVAWKNLKDAGFPDRIAWMRSAAATRLWMDLDRVGIFGGSAGGQSAMRALIDHSEFYKAAFADCGCHDNRMDKVWWNEQWLGWPVDDSYVRNSNVADAAKVKGALMLCVGELDHNVDPSSTMQVVNALEKADKDFELLVMTGSDHGAAETPYGSRRRMDFFVRHLLGVEPRHP
jgi:dipeptidyl aminopeptidase/acylaminoacyl peptidase